MSVSADMAMKTKNPTADTAGRIHGVETVKERSQQLMPVLATNG